MWKAARWCGRRTMRRSMCFKLKIMDTTIKIDSALLDDALKLSKLQSKKAVVDEALKQFIDRLRRKAMLELRGNVSWEGDLNQMRETR